MRTSLVHLSWRRVAFFALLWFVLSEGHASSWLIGVPVVLIAAAFNTQGSRPDCTPSWRGALAFVPYFIAQSIAGGVDVATRAWRRDMHLDPAMLTYHLRLPPGPARHLFINVITLMPGTLSTRLVDHTLTVHVLNARGPVRRELEMLEAKVGRVFRMAMEAGEEV